ncbi:MAG: hypothetical protein M1827_007132 [Pycnora praestabilis]|nr:MAG: hypothetical protein M1827_007132 [Pycnora praestabilis]
MPGIDPHASSSLALSRSRASPIIQVLIGPTQTTYALPQTLLCQHSPFFLAALAHPFAESLSRTVTLPDDSPEIFELFVTYLYTSTFTNPEPKNIWTEKAWVLGDKLGCTGFKDEAMRRLWEEYEDEANVAPPAVRYAYENTYEGSALRRFFADVVGEGVSEGVLDVDDCGIGDAEGEGYYDGGWKALFDEGGDFVLDVMRVLRDKQRKQKDGDDYDVPLELGCPSKSRDSYLEGTAPAK